MVCFLCVVLSSSAGSRYNKAKQHTVLKQWHMDERGKTRWLSPLEAHVKLEHCALVTYIKTYIFHVKRSPTLQLVQVEQWGRSQMGDKWLQLNCNWKISWTKLQIFELQLKASMSKRQQSPQGWWMPFQVIVQYNESTPNLINSKEYSSKA